jgi:spermidine synthase
MSVGDDGICFKRSRYIVYQPYVGLHLAYHAKRFCFSGQSKYQRIDIIENEAYGRMLLLNDNIQHTSYDARVFNEALCGAAKRNELARLIVLGGGSGQTAMSLLESPEVNQVTVVEIDEMVVEACRKHIVGVKQAFDDPRVRIVIADAFEYVHEMREHFDTAIVDLTEIPFGLMNNSAILKQLYVDVKEKCEGRCSQYIGSSVGLADGPRFRLLVDSESKRFLSGVRYEEVFIPSFGAPHTFMHAGYNR